MEIGIFSPPPAAPLGGASGGAGGLTVSSLTRGPQSLSEKRCSKKHPGYGSDVQIRHVQGVRLDEEAPGFDRVAHENREDLVGLHGIFDPDLQQPARGWIHRRFP